MKVYETPELEIIAFEGEDIIATSGYEEFPEEPID